MSEILSSNNLKSSFKLKTLPILFANFAFEKILMYVILCPKKSATHTEKPEAKNCMSGGCNTCAQLLFNIVVFKITSVK